MIAMTEYLAGEGLRLGEAEFSACCERFAAEMEAGLQGRESSLKMIPAYLNMEAPDTKEQRVLAVDMGGTNLRIAVVERGQEGMRILSRRQYFMPGKAGRLTKGQFFAQVAALLAPEAAESSRIGLCFSFPCEILPSLEGRVLGFNKEVSVAGAAGMLLGEELNAALAAAGLPAGKQVTVVNDTVAALLGARAAAKRPYGGYLGFILGTGTNSCYSERNANIKKSTLLRDLPDASLINLESGGFAPPFITKADRLFDASTAAPGAQLFEKMIAGGYQGGLALAHLQHAARADCFAAPVKEKLLALKTLQPKELDAFYLAPQGENPLAALLEKEEASRRAAHQLLDALFDRAALLAVCNLAAVLQKTGAGRKAERPVCVSAEGGTFYNCKPLHDKILAAADALLRRKRGLHFEFVRAGESTLLGSALAALCPPAICG